MIDDKVRETDTDLPAFDVIGKPHKLIEGREKITGRARYAGDVSLPNMLHARPVLSLYAHAKIKAIHLDEAKKIPGVVAVYRAEDLPTKDRVIASRNSAILAKDRVLFVGQPIAVVVAETDAIAQDAADMIDVEYEELTTVIDLEEAAKDDAYVIWPEGLPTDTVETVQHAAVESGAAESDKITNIQEEHHFAYGDVEAGFAESDVIIERTYRTHTVHQGYLEPHAAVADPDVANRSMTIYSSTQGQFAVRNEVAHLLSLPKRNVRVIPMMVGGGFGAKYGIIDSMVASIAYAVGQPVRLTFTRAEDFMSTTPAPATHIELKLGAKKDGKLAALQARVLIDDGAFAFPFGNILSLLLGSYYKVPNLKIDGYDVISNKAHAGAYRAPGAPQATFAIESSMEDIAAELGMDPLEFRYLNAAETGDKMASGGNWPSLGLKLCLEQLREHPAWKNQHKDANEGIGIAVGGWPCAMSPAAAVCRVDNDGTVRIHVGSVDISRSNSSFVLVAAELLGVRPVEVELVAGDSQTGPFAPGSGGSQVTYSVSGAVANAAKDARQKLLELAAEQLEARIDDIELREGKAQVKGTPTVGIAIAELAALAQRKKGGPGPIVGEGSAAVSENAPGFVAHLVKVHVDPDTGFVTPKQYVAIQDVGMAINPLMVEGQMQGGAVQAIGWGLHEALVYDEQGQVTSGNFMEYSMPRTLDVPMIETIQLQNPSPNGPYGARGVGEPPVTAGAAAIANAIKDATGVRVDQLPIRARTLWEAMQKN